MVTFIVIAIALCAAMAALVAVPLLRRDPRHDSPARGAALAAIGVLAVGGAAFYATFSNWSWTTTQSADSPEAMVARLARRLERNPQDLEGWLMLGRSYVALEQHRLAVRAFQRADQVSGGRNAEALVGMAEALALEDESALDGKAGELLEQALVLDPRSTKALYYGAAVAMRRGDPKVARERLTAMLELNPPENVRSILDQQIAALDAQLEVAQATSASAAAPETGNAPPAELPVVRVNVSLASSLSASLPAAAPLFVIVRDPNQPGPPLAVKRLPSQFPQTVELTAADAMVANRAFSAGQQVQVVARVARSGSPMAQSGDPFGEADYRVGRDGVVSIVIDRLTP